MLVRRLEMQLSVVYVKVDDMARDRGADPLDWVSKLNPTSHSSSSGEV